MRHPRRYALATALVLLVGCSRDESTTPAATPAPNTPATAAATDSAQPPANAPDRVFSQEELDQMVAPIALYPDPLLAQVLMASTYPGDVADAAKWSAAHPDATGDAAVKQVADQPWDPSVQSLVAFPQALATLEQDPAWVTRLGDAFLAQPDEVMDAVQRLRRQAQSAGTLSSNEYQNVSEQTVATDPPPAAASQTTVVEQAPASEQVIVIQPSDPQTVYVPSYNPTTAYGSWPYPSYPPAYYPPPPRYYPVGDALLTGMAFGVGVAVVDSLWGEPHWGYHDYGYGGHNYVDIDVNRYNNINVNNRRDINQSSWSHNAVNRDGVPYRDRNSRQQYGRNLEGERDREAFRGDDPQRAEARAKARSSMDSRGLNAATSNRDALNSAREANRSGGVPAGDARDRARDAAAGRSAAGAGSADAREHAREVAANRSGGSGDARDHARDVAANRTGGGNNDARQRAQSAAQKASSNPQARQKAQTAASKAKTSPKASQAANRAKSNRSSQANSQARSQVRKQAAPQHTAPKNNAFQGASRPNATHAQASRGHASQAAARKPPASRPPARQVSRPAHPPQRSGGGGGRRR